MQEIINFIVDNWQYISIALVVLLEIISMVIKKRGFLNVPSSFYKEILDLVTEAEKIYGQGHGKEKLHYVTERYMSDNNIVVMEYEIKYLVNYIVDQILSTPTKKGGPGREQENK